MPFWIEVSDRHLTQLLLHSSIDLPPDRLILAFSIGVETNNLLLIYLTASKLIQLNRWTPELSQKFIRSVRFQFQYLIELFEDLDLTWIPIEDFTSDAFSVEAEIFDNSELRAEFPEFYWIFNRDIQHFLRGLDVTDVNLNGIRLYLKSGLSEYLIRQLWANSQWDILYLILETEEIEIPADLILPEIF